MSAELEALQDMVHKIRNWVNAYPLDVFPEPDMKRARFVLNAHGMSLDAISASNMRHVLEGVKRIIGEDVGPPGKNQEVDVEGFEESEGSCRMCNYWKDQGASFCHQCGKDFR